MNPTMTKLAIRDTLLSKLIEASRQRDQWPDTVTDIDGEPEFAWVVHERTVMRNLTDIYRAEAGLPKLTDEQMLWAERQAAGHSDYAEKYALYCAEFAMAER